MKESILQKKLIIMASQLGHRLFRCQTAQGWVGESARFTKEQKIFVYPGDVLVRKARPLHAGLTDGGSDLVGWSKDGRFLAIETKTTEGTTAKERKILQQNFIDAVNKSGGIAGIVRTEEEGFELFSA